MNRCSHPPHKKRHWRRKKKKLTAEQNNYALYRSSQGLYSVPKIDTAPSSSDGGAEESKDDTSALPLNTTMDTEEAHNHANSESGSLLDDDAFRMEGEMSRLHVFETHEDTTDSEAEEHSTVGAMPPDKLPDYKEAPPPDYAVEHESTENALNDYLEKRGVALQISANGSLEPLDVPSLAPSALPSKMQWNLDPLLMMADSLLPLHIACLYRASPPVISHLLEAYPKAVREQALGMLPIHMVCAGFHLPEPVLAPPIGPVPFPHDDEYDMAESLRRLEKAFPESVNYPSESNGMTPKTYIDETLDDGAYKDTCLEALGVKKEASIMEETVNDVEDADTRVSDHDNTTLTTR